MITIQKERIFGKNLLGNKKMVFKNGVINILTAAYDGVNAVF